MLAQTVWLWNIFPGVFPQSYIIGLVVHKGIQTTILPLNQGVASKKTSSIHQGYLLEEPANEMNTYLALSREWGNESLSYILINSFVFEEFWEKPFRFQTSTTPQGVVVFFVVPWGWFKDMCWLCFHQPLQCNPELWREKFSFPKCTCETTWSYELKKHYSEPPAVSIWKPKKIVFEIVGGDIPQTGSCRVIPVFGCPEKANQNSSDQDCLLFINIFRGEVEDQCII